MFQKLFDWISSWFMLWNFVWFQNFIAWCRKWKWFDTYIYGKSVDLEDFVRNPAEVLRDTYPPFIFKGVKGYSLINLRLGYKYYNTADTAQPKNCQSVAMGNNKLVWKIGSWTIADLRVWNPWCTKFCNSIFFFQLGCSFKNYIPIPYVSMCFKIAPIYFQFGLLWGYEKVTASGDKDCAVLSGKFRIVKEDTSNEAALNSGDVKGYYEGTI